MSLLQLLSILMVMNDLCGFELMKYVTLDNLFDFIIIKQDDSYILGIYDTHFE